MMKKLCTEDVKIFDDIYYCLNDDGKSVTILGCTGSAACVAVPSEINGMPVTQIESSYVPGARLEWSAGEVIVPAGIVIGNKAFAHSPIEKVTLRSGVVLQHFAFEACEQLTEINLEPGVAFEKRTALWKAERDKQTGNLFFNFYGVSANLNASRTWIECFEEKMTIGDMLKEGTTFQSMYNDGVFSRCEALTEIVIPEGVEFLPNYTFCACTSLCKITLPQSLKAIGAGCFCGCINLANIVLPEGLVLIGEDAFETCSKLQTVVLPKSLTHMTANPFGKCKSLARMVVPSGMTGPDGRSEVDETIYPYASFWHVDTTAFSKETFYAQKSWKQIFKAKASKITTEMPASAELDEETAHAMEFVHAQTAFDKQKEIVIQITDYFLENTKLQSHTTKYAAKDITALKKQLYSFIDALQEIAKKDAGNREAILAQVKNLVEYVNDFDEKFRTIETEDREGICMVIDTCAGLAGFEYPDDDMHFDITDAWRRW